MVKSKKSQDTKKKKKTIKKQKVGNSKYQKTREKNYSIESMQKALDTIGCGKTIRDAAKEFGIPKSTLHLKLKKKLPLVWKKGPKTVLTTEEEDELQNWIIHCAEAGFPINKTQLLDHVQKYLSAIKRQNKFTDNRPGKEWYSLFMKRHPDLSVRVAQNLTTSRMVEEKDIRLWFYKVEKYLSDKNCLDCEPDRIFNLDESAFQLVPKDNTVITKKGSKSVYQIVGKNEKATLTVLFIASASGKMPPPMILFNLKNIPKKEILQNIPKDWGVGFTEGGWMNAESFCNCIKNVFYKWLVDNGVKFPVVVYADNHSLHVSLELLKFCQEKKIELVGLFPNSTHILQPLDVSLFHLLKEKYRAVLRQWRVDNNVIDFKKSMFAPVLHLALTDSDYSTAIIHGFKTCGLYPFDPDAVRYDFLNRSKKSKNSQNIVEINNKNRDEECTSKKSNALSLLQVFENNILTPETLAHFKNQEFNSTWTGDISLEGLFYSWKKMKQEIEKSGLFFKNL